MPWPFHTVSMAVEAEGTRDAVPGCSIATAEKAVDAQNYSALAGQEEAVRLWR